MAIATVPTQTVSFFVRGIPRPAGSKKGYPIRRKDGSIGVAMAPASEKSKPWMYEVKQAALAVCKAPMTGPLKVRWVFVMPRPTRHYRTGKYSAELKANAPLVPMTTPDMTKLVRCAEDALRGVAWVDDAQVASQVNDKVYGVQHGLKVTIAPYTYDDLEAVAAYLIGSG